MDYYYHFGHSLTLKNNLEKDIYLYLKSLDGTLIPSDKFAEFGYKVTERIAELNQTHPKCKAIEVKFSLLGSKNIYLSGFAQVNVNLYPILNTYGC